MRSATLPQKASWTKSESQIGTLSKEGTVQLFGGWPPRWIKPYWMLQELGAEFVPIPATEQTQATNENTPRNLYWTVPVLIDGDIVLQEASHIMNYLGQKYPASRLIPTPGTLAKKRYEQWLSYITDDFERPLTIIDRTRQLRAHANQSESKTTQAREDFKTMAAILDNSIPDFLLGSHFSAADIAMTHALQRAKAIGLLSGFKNLESYRARHAARPSFPMHLYGCIRQTG